ncbi:hypothetical protein GCK32_013346 [Trichostrongylus colubriformis]|uniref:Uncharacterized protein n=1 Tax=Trichostrongylus colubriformis TaxID=6319 RepID=A0AAN8F274_TRICO
MNSSTLGILLFLVGLSYGYINPKIYRRALIQEGVPERMIPQRELDQLIQKVDRAQTTRDIDLAEREFQLAVRKSYRYRFPRLDAGLARVNRIFRWIITFQTQLGRMINAFNLPASAGFNLLYNIRSGYQRDSRKHQGDFSKIHRALKGAVLKEAAKWLDRDELGELLRRLNDLDRREYANIMRAYRLTRPN